MQRTVLLLLLIPAPVAAGQVGDLLFRDGYEPTAQISVAPTPAFPPQLAGTSSPPLTLAITNVGSLNVDLSEIGNSGVDASDFVLDLTGTLLNLGPAGTTTLKVTFAPSLPWRSGTRQAQLNVLGNVQGGVVAVAESGQGVTCGGGAPACSSGCADSDGDGLNDAWEIAGAIDSNNDGVIDAINDLQLPNADPNKPNIYVKYDYFVEAGSGTTCAVNTDCAVPGEVCDTGSAVCVKHTHAPSAVALDTVRTAFSNHGVILTFFSDPIAGGKADALVEHIDQLLNHSDSIVSYASGAVLAAEPECAGPGGVSFYDLKGAHFPARMAPAYHYAVFSHYVMCDESQYVGLSCIDDSECQAIDVAFTCDNFRCSNASHCSACPTLKGQPPQPGASGLAENDNFQGGNDLVVSLGGFLDHGPVTDTMVAGTFMHELGHNLALTHGGGLGAGNFERYKPNFLSVMGYSYQFTGIGITAGSGAFATSTVDPSTSYRIDYSEEALPTLDETNLDESTGLQGLVQDKDVAVFYANFGTCKVYAPTNGSPVDWDVAPPVNGQGQCLPYTSPPPYNDSGISIDISASGAKTQLLGHRDWDDLLYKFQCSTDGLADGAPIALAAMVSRDREREPAIQDGELTYQEAYARHIIYPQRRVAVALGVPAGAKLAATGQRTVTLLGSADLDVTQIEFSSLGFGGASATAFEIRDVNGDGRADLVLTFGPQRMRMPGPAPVLSGWFRNSQEFVGEVTAAARVSVKRPN